MTEERRIANGQKISLPLSFWLFAIFFPVMISLSGCVDDPDNAVSLPIVDTSESFYELKLVEAWIEFDSGNYRGAILKFGEAVNIDPLRANAYLGLGWSYAMSDKLEESLYNFELANIKEMDNPDGYASMAFIYLAQKNFNAAISAADKAILLGGEEYVFLYIPEVRTRNLRLLMAECYYVMGQYAKAQEQIDILEPDNELNQNSSVYKEDLLLKIESLKSDGPIISKL